MDLALLLMSLNSYYSRNTPDFSRNNLHYRRGLGAESSLNFK